MAQLIRRTPNRAPVCESLYGHTGFVEDVLALPSGLLLSVDSEGEVIVWDVEAKRPIERFSVSTSPLGGIGTIPGSEDVVVWGWEGALLRLSVPDLTGIVRVDLHDDRILSADFGFVGSRRVAATGSMDDTACLVDIDTGELLFRTEPHGFWVIEAFVWNDHLVTVSRDGTVRMFSEDGQAVEVFRLEGGHFVSAGIFDNRVVAASIDGTVMCVDLEAKTTETFAKVCADEPTVIGLDAEFVWIGASDGRVVCMALQDGEVVGEVSAHDSGVLGGHAEADFIVSFGLDRRATVISKKTLEVARRIDAHDNLVSAATALGAWVVTGSADTTIKLHDPTEDSGTPTERHSSMVTGMKFVDGRLISWGYGDPVARAWDPATGTVVSRRLGHVDQVASVERFRGQWMSTSHDGTARLSDDFEGTDATVLGLAKGIRDAAITGPSTVALATMIGSLIHLDVDHGELWRFDNGREIFDVEADDATGSIVFGDRDFVCVLDEDGELQARFDGRAFGVVDGRLWVFPANSCVRYDLADGTAEHDEIEIGAVERVAANHRVVIATDSGGRITAFDGDGTIRWQIRPVERAANCIHLEDDILMVGWHYGGAAAIDVRDGSIVLRDEGDSGELIVDVTTDRRGERAIVVAWDEVRLHMLDGSETHVISGFSVRPQSAWFVGDSIWIGGFGDTLYLWPDPQQDLIAIHRHSSIVAGLGWFDDGRLVSWGWDGRVVVDDPSGEFQREWGGHGSFVYGVAEFGDDIVTWSFDATARLWDREGTTKEVFRTRTRGIEGGAKVGDAMWLGTSGGELYAWQPRERRVMLYEAGEWHRGVVKFVVGYDDFVATACRAGRLGVWDAENLKNVAFWDVPESGGFASLAVHPEGRLVVAGGESGRLFAVDPLEGKVVFDITAHGACVEDVTFAPDRDVLFSTSEDGTLAAWNLEGALLGRARLDGEGYSVAAQAGGLVAAGDTAGRVLFFDFAPEVH